MMVKRKTGGLRRGTLAPPGKAQEEIARLRQRLEEAEESLDAIRSGSVDALVIKGPNGDQIFTLKDADRPYRTIIENMGDGAVTIREDGLILYANKQFAEIMGLSLEKLLGGNLFDLAGPRSRAALKELIDKAGKAGAHEDVEFARGSGRPLLVHLSLAPMKIDGIQALAGVTADVTEERLTQQRLRQMERTEALGRLAGGVAHDLNNILQPIIVNAELLLEEAEPGSSRWALLNNMIEAANRQKSLVKRILSFTRQTKRVLSPLAVTPLVVEAVNLLKPSLPGNIEIDLIADSLEDTANGDPSELHELVTNLCSNAADAMEERGGTIEISLRNVTVTAEDAKPELQPGRFLKLTFKDAGIGIPARDLDRVFDPFFTTKAAGKGTGIGLSVVKGIVNGHGGSITVESEVGRGTEVAVHLPLVCVPHAPAVKGTWDRPESSSGRRILVVDDEDMVLDTIQRALSSFGHKPTVVNDASAALALFRSVPRQFELAIIDQNMPGVTGLEMAAEMRRLNASIPILLATGYSKAVDDRSLQASGVTAVLMKPLSLKDLMTAIGFALADQRKRE